MDREISALFNTNTLSYRIYSDLFEIKEISREWEMLLEASPCVRTLGSAEWYIASCRALDSLIPYLVVAFSGSEIVGILPLMLNQKDGVARFPPYIADYNDIISRRDNPLVIADLLNYAMLFQNRCDRIVLSRLRPDSNCIQSIPFIATNPNIKFHYRETDTYYYINLPGSFDDYLASRSKAFRKSIRRAQRNFEKSGLVIRELQPDDFDPAQLPELFISLATTRQKEKSFFRHSHAQSFVREVLPLFFDNRSLRVSAILDGEWIIALDLCLVEINGLGAWNGGFLEEAESWSPGTVLFAHGIMQAIAMKLDEYDFLRGDEDYKRSWANGNRTIGEIELIAKR